MGSASQHLALHGAIVLILGMLLGIPYASAVKREAAAHIVNAWRRAHWSLPIAGTLMLVIAALLPSMRVATFVTWLITIALTVSAYGFSVSLPLAAITGQRGPAAGRTGLGRLVHLGNIVGAVMSMIGLSGLLYAASASL
jgi:hypothetical protein